MNNSVVAIGRRKFILIAIIVVVIIISAVIFIFLPRSNRDDTVTKTQVPHGDVTTPNSSSSDTNSSNHSQDGQSGSSQNSSSTPPTNQQFYDLILQTNGIAPDTSGQINFGITGVKNPLPGWYIVTISVAGTQPSKVIFQETGIADTPLTIVAGPGTDFPPAVIHIPDAVRSAL